ncbi:hypothetical protein GP486_003678 [Trichoglossum hirsutum]|uniref:Protein kinase domain-containing protein n=1 Tax=Trichoglossum hirsutum TaxID=265104 RepID=A0A9P8LCT2_9PEZI|nr:hypothetical protein GP486_003678 [Trichoglossum hirsutum]
MSSGVSLGVGSEVGSGVGSGGTSRLPGIKVIKEWMQGTEKAEKKAEKKRIKKKREEMRQKIDERIQRPGEANGKFVTAKSLQEVWRFELERFLEDLGLGDQEQWEFVDTNLLKTLSILVYMRWDNWSKFTEVFMKDGQFRKDRVDSKLPYQLTTLRDKSFLGGWGSSFIDHQYIFIPIVLTQGKIETYRTERRLPLNTGSKELGSGAFGKVTEEVIPPGQLVLMSGGKESHPQKDYTVARKVLFVKKDFIAEKRNLEILRGALMEHKHIVLNIAAVTIGNEFNLFFDKAKTDLGKYLYGLTEPVDLKGLIEEALNLSDALRFLHEDLTVKGGTGSEQKTCCHSDLKPDNILVYEEAGNSIGKWKISDFGTSTIGNLLGESEMADYTNMTVVAKQRARGVYTAPEPNAGRRGDIWSFGCILHQVVAAGLGGGTLLRALDKEREGIADVGRAMTSSNFYNEVPSGRVLKSCVVRWLEQNLVERQDPFPGKCSKLIMDMLQIEKSQRPKARDVKVRLGEIIGRNMGQEQTTASSEGGGENLGPSQESESVPPPTSPPASLFRSLSTSPPASLRTTPPTSLPASPPTSPPLSPISSALPQLSQNLILAIEKRNPDAVNARLGKGGERVLQALLSSEQLRGDGGIKGINQRDDSGATPLYHAASGGKTKIASKLIDNGADINAVDNYGRSPLHMASQGVGSDHTDLAELLLDRGAKITSNLPPQFKDKHNHYIFRKRKQEKEARRR